MEAQETDGARSPTANSYRTIRMTLAANLNARIQFPRHQPQWTPRLALPPSVLHSPTSEAPSPTPPATYTPTPIYDSPLPPAAHPSGPWGAHGASAPTTPPRANRGLATASPSPSSPRTPTRAPRVEDDRDTDGDSQASTFVFHTPRRDPDSPLPTTPSPTARRPSPRSRTPTTAIAAASPHLAPVDSLRGNQRGSPGATPRTTTRTSI